MRKYKTVVLYDDHSVMFKMENGWNYIVSDDVPYVGVFALAGSYANHTPYCQAGTPPDDLLKKAEKLLQELSRKAEVTGRVFRPGQRITDEEHMPPNPHAKYEQNL